MVRDVAREQGGVLDAELADERLEPLPLRPLPEDHQPVGDPIPGEPVGLDENLVALLRRQPAGRDDEWEVIARAR